MSFRFPQGGRAFFRAIEASRDGPRKFLMFDAFYCCFLIGLDARLVGREEDLEGDVFLNGYPEDYRTQADVVAGLLIDAELDRKEIRSEDRASIEREMVKLIDPTSTTRLSGDGNALLNLYAASGFALLRDRMMPPATVEEFLVAFHAYWHQAS